MRAVPPTEIQKQTKVYKKSRDISHESTSGSQTQVCFTPFFISLGEFQIRVHNLLLRKMVVYYKDHTAFKNSTAAV